jgi:signal transduction histidine kinase
MNALPPPVAPSSVPPPPAPHRPSNDSSSRSAPDGVFGDVDWDRLQALARRWYAPLAERHTWMAAMYLFVGIFSAVGFFIAINAIGWTAFGLMFIGVGVLLVKPFFLAVDALCRADRAMARWVGIDIPPRPLAPLSGLGLNALRDSGRWRQVGFLALNVVIGTLIGTAGTSAYFAAPSFVFDGPFDTGTVFGLGPILWVIGIAFGAFMLGAAPRIAVFAGHLKGQITAWFLGPDQLAEARQRVDTLAFQRQDILDAVAAERRRIERNLHDGVQHQLVAIGLDLGMAEHQIDRDPTAARELIVSARQKVQGSIGELRQLGRGLHPAILADRGVDAALSAIVASAPIPVSVAVDPDLDLSTDAAETVYFIANEAIANVLKHAHARVASVHVIRTGDRVRVTVHDDGDGGVDASKGTGIAGIRARVHAVDGTFTVTSPMGGPTTLVAEIPHARQGGG